jgi:hypothetical protein
MNEYRLEGVKEGPAMTGSDLIFAAEVAFASGLFEEIPTTPD